MSKRSNKSRTWRCEGIKVREKVKGSGVWWVFVSLGNGKRVSQRGGSKDEAEALATELRETRELTAASRRLEAAGLLPATPAATSTTFAAYAATFFERNKPNDQNPDSLKHSTWVDYSQCVAGRLSALDDFALSAIRRRHVKDLEAKWRAEGVKANNIAKHVRVLSSILSEAAEDELIDVNPLLNRGRRRRRSTAKAPKAEQKHPFTRDELDTLLTTAETHTVVRRGETVYPFRDALPFLLALADTGMRLGEAVALRWSDIDWHGGFVHIQWSYTKGVLARPKNGKTRHVELSSRLRAALRQLRAERFGRVVALSAADQAALEAEQANRQGGALVFPDAEGGHLDDSNLRRRLWHPLLAAAKLSHHRIHDLRHTFATLHLQAGSDALWVSAQLGHHSVAFTLRQYVSRPQNDRRRFSDVLAAKWSRNDPAPAAGTHEAETPDGQPQSDSVPTAPITSALA